MAGVRNGYGFAGCYRHEPLTPISEDRGLPEWLLVDGDYTPSLYNKWCGRFEDEEEMGCWMGDHSHTYMTLNEIISWEGWDKHLSQGGVVNKNHYMETLHKGKSPEAWSGGVGGSSVLVEDEDVFKSKLWIGADTKEITHIQCRWKSDQTLREMYSWWLDEIKRIGDEHGYQDTYLVVGFDS